ncbi:hypothetical protein GCM10023324_25840 [Streptomyces youssoufiensis]
MPDTGGSLRSYDRPDRSFSVALRQRTQRPRVNRPPPRATRAGAGAGCYSPHRSAGVRTGASHRRSNSSSAWHSVTAHPAMSSEVT